MEEESGMLLAPGCDHRRDAWPMKLLQVVGGGRRAIRTVDDFILDLFLFFPDCDRDEFHHLKMYPRSIKTFFLSFRPTAFVSLVYIFPSKYW